jgi:hypothetical protein
MLALLFGAVSLLYATVGQAGGTAFLAVMAFSSFADRLGCSIAGSLSIGQSFGRSYWHHFQPLFWAASLCWTSEFTML